MRGWVPGIVLVLLVAAPFSLADAATGGSVHIDLGRRLSEVQIHHHAGQLTVEVPGPNGGERELSPQAYIAALKHQQERQAANPLFLVFNITTWGGVVWVGLGLLGQVLFTGRMIVQWLVSEKHKRSVVPVAFWWLSVTGASMLVLYFIWRKDIVGVLGQSTGWAIYVRNLWLIYRQGSANVSAGNDPAPEAELSEG